MEKICSKLDCQNFADVVCLCENVAFCDLHISSHVMNEGNHSVQPLRVIVSSEAKSSLIYALKLFSARIQNARNELKKTSKNIIEKIYLDVTNCDKKLQNLQKLCFKIIIIYSDIKRVFKSSENYMDKLLQTSQDNITIEFSKWTIPSIEYNIKTYENIINLKGECIPFTKFPAKKQCEMLKMLKSTSKISLKILSNKI